MFQKSSPNSKFRYVDGAIKIINVDKVVIVKVLPNCKWNKLALKRERERERERTTYVPCGICYTEIIHMLVFKR